MFLATASVLMVAGLGLSGCASEYDMAREAAVTSVHAQEAGLRSDVNLAALHKSGAAQFSAVQAVLVAETLVAEQTDRGIVVTGILIGTGAAGGGLVHEQVGVRLCFEYEIPDSTGRIDAKDVPCDPQLALLAPASQTVSLKP